MQTQFHSDFEAPAPAAPTYSVITGDGSVEYDSDGVRVLRAIGTWYFIFLSCWFYLLVVWFSAFFNSKY